MDDQNSNSLRWLQHFITCVLLYVYDISLKINDYGQYYVSIVYL